MVESNVTATKTTQESNYNQAWVKALVEQDVFEGDPGNWRITVSNYTKVLLAIKVNVTQFE